MNSGKVRIGIDVGGTFTKAVVIDNDTLEIIGKSSVLTTHSAEEGVAKGVIHVFQRVLEDHRIDPRNVVFLAHSTTQATNALLEGDLAPVGIIGMAGGSVTGFLAKNQTVIGDIPLVTGRVLKTVHTFINTKKLTPEEARAAIEDLIRQGARVIVASDSFSVDDPSNELIVMDAAQQMGVPATGGHEISKLYGLTIRTRTAVINAGILPKMMETAQMTEGSVRKAGIDAPLMIMRGDGGVMDTAEMRKRPILTMLSGPSATVAGALMYLRVSDGIFFEVGGTSTNIGVIRNGRPTIKSAEVGGHRTYVNSLDIRVLGIAGGSMVRLKGKEIVDVGPRSAHIAGLPYAAFATPEEMVDPELIFVQPKQDDPSDFVAVRVKSGKTFALTNTCAANALGIVKPEFYSFGNSESARRAVAALAKAMGVTVEEAAGKILDVATDKVIPVINSLIAEYELDRDQVILVGGGGGAAALIPHSAKRMGFEYRIPKDAEVMSSIGVALAMVRDVVERVILNPTAEDIAAIRQEARQAVMKACANPESIEVFLEINPQTGRVRATAIGTMEMRSQEMCQNLGPDECRGIAAQSMNVPPEKVELKAGTEMVYVFQGLVEEKKWRLFTSRRRPVRVVDNRGFVKVQRSDGSVFQLTKENALPGLKEAWENLTIYNGDSIIFPDVFVIVGSHVVDLTGVQSIDQAFGVVSNELEGLAPDQPVAVVGMRGQRG
ncbi:MAG TPA: hydantoinase/oxoprolinase family protein, partial [Thermodesulfobacteriota bacterium]|nr:hydantoinase/oxoprolinase family protein [Thermodesulfobacteriota bacterium]